MLMGVVVRHILRQPKVHLKFGFWVAERVQREISENTEFNLSRHLFEDEDRARRREEYERI